MKRYKIAVLDDYQNAALESADWSMLRDRASVVGKVTGAHLLTIHIARVRTDLGAPQTVSHRDRTSADRVSPRSATLRRTSLRMMLHLWTDGGMEPAANGEPDQSFAFLGTQTSPPHKHSGEDPPEPSRRAKRCRPSPLVLLSRRRAAFWEWPDTVRKLQGQQAVVLACRPKRSACAIQVHLSRTPVWTAGMEVSPEVVVRSRTWRRRSGRIEVRNLLRSHRIANVEHPDAGVEHTARQSRSAMAIIDTAVVRSISKDRQPH